MLAGRPTISRTLPGWDGDRAWVRDGVRSARADFRVGAGRARDGRGRGGAGRLPGQRRPGTGLRNSRSAQRNSGASPGLACVMRAQRDAVHLSSRGASPARHNPSALDPCEPAWRNASPGDITNSTPPVGGEAGLGGGVLREVDVDSPRGRRGGASAGASSASCRRFSPWAERRAGPRGRSGTASPTPQEAEDAQDMMRAGGWGRPTPPGRGSDGRPPGAQGADRRQGRVHRW